MVAYGWVGWIHPIVPWWQFINLGLASSSEVSMSLPWLFRLLGLGIPSTMMMISGLTGMIGASFASLKVNPRHMSAAVTLNKAHEIGCSRDRGKLHIPQTGHFISGCGTRLRPSANTQWCVCSSLRWWGYDLDWMFGFPVVLAKAPSGSRLFWSSYLLIPCPYY